ncbi:hypothetical protein NDU88_001772 [Pleurodeles waltl]|uniref:Uncharacterized protein n=1 Tax=Pleurodeles waltl TaxID=8319 RepID=A0AAV7W0Z2_PLEWA|nr:hypothetical protein NDU88_001772 [Pleurodeles waltl]
MHHRAKRDITLATRADLPVLPRNGGPTPVHVVCGARGVSEQALRTVGSEPNRSYDLFVEVCHNALLYARISSEETGANDPALRPGFSQENPSREELFEDDQSEKALERPTESGQGGESPEQVSESVVTPRESPPSHANCSRYELRGNSASSSRLKDPRCE